MRPDFDAVYIFAKVVEQAGFVAAARVLGMPKATVSRRVAALEERLGVRLLQRTTRKVAPTEAGQRYYEHAQRIAAEFEGAEAGVAAMRGRPSGLVRVSVSAALSHAFIGPVVAEYLRLHPGVLMRLDVTNRMVDLVEEGVDVAVRVGTLRASGLVARRLGSGVGALYASPAYLAERGCPAMPEGLAQHSLVDEVLAPGEQHRWTLRRDGAEHLLAFRPLVAANDAATAVSLLVSGAGIGRAPVFMAAAHVHAGTLEPVLPGWTANEVEVNALFPSHKGLNPAVRAFVDQLAQRLPGLLAGSASLLKCTCGPPITVA